MKKRKDNSARASALQITLSVAVLSVAAILLASNFRAASPAAAPAKKDGFYPPLPDPAMTQQSGFYQSLSDQGCGTYTSTTGTAAIVPGTVDTGNHTDDGTTPITLPFGFIFYGTTFSSANVSSNGNLQFSSTNIAFTNNCLPDATMNNLISPFWDDQCTGPCFGVTGTTYGIFTSTTGTCPNRIFNIEWRAAYYNSGGTGIPLNYEIRLYETTGQIDFVYGILNGTGSSATVGLQKVTGSAFTQFECNTGGLSNGMLISWTQPGCPSPTPNCTSPTPTATATATVPPTPTPTPSPCSPMNPLWYNGDFNNINGLANETNTSLTGFSSVYDNFTVTGTGWFVNEVFSNNLENTVITGASWEIRSSVSAGNGGTLVASGTTTTPVVTATGRSAFGFTEFQIKVTGLNVFLPPLALGQFYWLNVTPFGDGTGRSFVSTTSGANCVGTPCGNDMNAFINSTQFSATFAPTGNAPFNQPYDFSMGLNGTVGCFPTPTPTATFTGTPTPSPTATSTATATATATATPTIPPTPTPTPSPCFNYTANVGTGAIVPGATDTGNHTDDGMTPITLPFFFNFYGTSFITANVSSNGNLQFSSTTTTFTNACPLPDATMNNLIAPHWDDLRTDAAGSGIFTSVNGTCPNRIFNIEWRATYFSSGLTLNFEIRLYETTGQIDFIYGTMNGTGLSATVGLQKDTGSLFTQFSCNTASLSDGMLISWTLPGCPTPTPNCTTPSPTPTATATATATATPTGTPTATATASPTPTATVPPCGLVVNPGFETGDFSGWTQSGTTNFTSVSTTMPHSGTYAALLGPTAEGFLTQTLTTIANQSYNVSFWLAVDSGTPNDFSATFAGVTIYSVVNSATFGYTQFAANVIAPTTSSVLQFAFENTPAYWHLDDICVVAAVPSPTPTPTPSQTPTPTPTPTFNISGTVGQCTSAGVSGAPLAGVTMTLTGSSGGSTTTNASGNYSLSGFSGGSYTVTPTKTYPTGSLGFNVADLLAIQGHILARPGFNLTGTCRALAADVSNDGNITTSDIIGVNAFILQRAAGFGRTGQCLFNPTSRSYPSLAGDQPGQNYDTIVYGNVTGANPPRPGGPPPDAPGVSTVALVALPEITVEQSKSNFIAAVRTSEINAKNNLVGFQGDITFDERAVTFESEPVQHAGLTAGNWNVSGNVLPGAGPIRTLRVTAYSTDFAPLSGSGTLFELRMTRVSKAAQGTQLAWAPSPNQFIFIDADLNTQTVGNAASGSVMAQ